MMWGGGRQSEGRSGPTTDLACFSQATTLKCLPNARYQPISSLPGSDSCVGLKGPAFDVERATSEEYHSIYAHENRLD